MLYDKSMSSCTHPRGLGASLFTLIPIYSLGAVTVWEKCLCNHIPNFFSLNLAPSSGKREGCPLAAALTNPLDSHSVFKTFSTQRKLQCVGNDELSWSLGTEVLCTCLFAALPSSISIIHVSVRKTDDTTGATSPHCLPNYILC